MFRFRHPTRKGADASHVALAGTVASLITAGPPPNITAHLKQFQGPEQIAAWLAMTRGHIDASRGTGLDFGCWSGVTTELLAALGAEAVVGIDIDQDFIDYATGTLRRALPGRTVYLKNFPGSIPLPSRSMDWIFVNQVFCNMHPDHEKDTLHELARVLKPGGTLLIIDSNNPYAEGTIPRLAALHASIRPCCPDLNDGWNAPVGATHGSASRVTDPFAFIGTLEACGLTCEISFSPQPQKIGILTFAETLCQSGGFYLTAHKT